MIQKVCLLGTFAVGKTSLVRRFVDNVYADKYLTTVGVKIDRKVIPRPQGPLSLMLWDIQGEDRFARILPTYVRGAAGCLLVADGTRPDTLKQALDLERRVKEIAGDVPMLLLVNKADLKSSWELDAARLTGLAAAGRQPIETSAKSGAGVEAAFNILAERILTG